MTGSDAAVRGLCVQAHKRQWFSTCLATRRAASGCKLICLATDAPLFIWLTSVYKESRRLPSPPPLSCASRLRGKVTSLGVTYA
jgi:hypothetical protein